MKNVTLSADEHLIETARAVAKARHTTLNQAFRDWLGEYTARTSDAVAVEELYNRLDYVSAGRKYNPAPKAHLQEDNEPLE